MSIEFRAWPKIGRKDPMVVTVTEKIDGTNGCIIVHDGEVVGVQSRNRLITPEDDNFGFASWVKANSETLKSLGDGYHYGEWAGPGIRKNPRNLEERGFFLFNTFRWGPPNLPPSGCQVVPVLYHGSLADKSVDNIMKDLWLLANARGYTPEGVVIYNLALRGYTKATFANPEGKWAAT